MTEDGNQAAPSAARTWLDAHDAQIAAVSGPVTRFGDVPAATR